jgi:hypothetical protein
MSTIKSSITIPPYPRGEFSQPLVHGALSPAPKRDCLGAVTRPQPEYFIRRLGAFFCECWWRMMVMKAAYERFRTHRTARRGVK